MAEEPPKSETTQESTENVDQEKPAETLQSGIFDLI